MCLTYEWGIHRKSGSGINKRGYLSKITVVLKTFLMLDMDSFQVKRAENIHLNVFGVTAQRI